MSTYRAEVSREDGFWVAVVEGLRGGATEARTLAGLEAEVKDLIAGLTDADEESFEVEFTYSEALRPAMQLVERILEAREQMEEFKAAYEAAQREAVQALADEHLSARDSARLVGLSHQRVSQLLNA